MRKVKLNRLDLEHVVREVGGGQFSHLRRVKEDRNGKPIRSTQPEGPCSAQWISIYPKAMQKQGSMLGAQTVR